MSERTAYAQKERTGKPSRKVTGPVNEWPPPTEHASWDITSVIRSDVPKAAKLSQIASDSAIVFLANTGEVVFLPGRSPFTRHREDKDAAAKITESMHDRHIIKPDHVPFSYWQKQRRIQREQGHGTVDMRSREWREFKKQATEALIADQRASLNTWINYLLSPDAAAAYSPNSWMWVLTEVVTMSRYDKERRRFRSRQSDEGKLSPFPELNPEALAMVIEVVNKFEEYNPEHEEIKMNIHQAKKRVKDLSRLARNKDIEGLDRTRVKRDLDKAQKRLDNLYYEEDTLFGFGSIFTSEVEDEGEEFRKKRLDTRNEIYQLVKSRNFSKLYAWAIETVTPHSTEGLSVIDGKWVKYDKGSDPKLLVADIQDKGTGWCTVGESTAKSQLEGGDFYVYYSLDSQNNPTIPRVAIRMEDDEIAEVRGVGEQQNLDSFIAPVVEEKLREFPDGELYKRKVSDMQRLTGIEQKMGKGEPLDGSELSFLYEVDEPIYGFGFDEDPRIDDLKAKRNADDDMVKIFGCEPSGIARSQEEITSATKAYVGPLTPGIFNTLRRFDIENIFTTFPHGKIRMEQLTIGGKSRSVLEDEMQQNGMDTGKRYSIREKPYEVTTLSEPTQIDVVRINASDLLWDGKYWGKPKMTLGNLYKRALQLGLDFCPAETAMHYRMQYTDQPSDWLDRMYIVMPSEKDDFWKTQDVYFSTVFALFATDGKMRLYEDRSYDDHEQYPRDEFLFLLPHTEKEEK